MTLSRAGEVSPTGKDVGDCHQTFFSFRFAQLLLTHSEVKKTFPLGVSGPIVKVE